MIILFFFIGSALEKASHTHTAFLKREKKLNIWIRLTKEEPEVTLAPKFHLRTALPMK